MDIKLLDKLMIIMDKAGYEQEKLKGYIDSGYVDCPSSSFVYNEEKDLFDKIDTQVFTDYPLGSKEVSLMLSLKDMNEKEIIDFLKVIINGLKEVK